MRKKNPGTIQQVPSNESDRVVVALVSSVEEEENQLTDAVPGGLGSKSAAAAGFPKG